MAVDDVDGPGDAAFGLDITIEVTAPFGVTAAGYGIFSVRDGVASSVSAVGAIDPETFQGEPADRAFVRALAERADDKLREQLDD